MLKESIDNRPGDYDKAAKDKIFIPRQTHKGLRITAHSSIVDCKVYAEKHNMQICTK